MTYSGDVPPYADSEIIMKPIDETEDRRFSHPDFGKEARVELWGNEVRLVFIASDSKRATELAEYLVEQMRNGAVNITVMGKPDNIAEETYER